jgi:hypothetical protein
VAAQQQPAPPTVETSTGTTAPGDTPPGAPPGGQGAREGSSAQISAKGAYAHSSGTIIATDRRGGTITISSGSYSTAGTDSPGIYSTGSIKVAGGTMRATGAEAAAIEGSNSVSLTRTTLSGAKKWGVMIYQRFSGDAQGSTATWRRDWGSLSAAQGPLFYVTNATAAIALDGVNTSAPSGVLLKAATGQWGTSSANGGTSSLVAIAQKLTGAVIVDKLSTAALKLTNGSAWTGAIDAPPHTAKSATVALGATSTWTVTATSHDASLTDPKVIGSKVIGSKVTTSSVTATSSTTTRAPTATSGVRPTHSPVEAPSNPPRSLVLAPPSR